MRALLPISVLLLSGCLDPTSETSTGPVVPQAPTSQSGGTSMASGGFPAAGSSHPASGPPAAGAGAAIPTGIWDVTGTVFGNPVSEVVLIAGGNYYALANVDEFGCADLTGGTYSIKGGLFTSAGTMLLSGSCPPLNTPRGYLPYSLNGYLTGANLNLSFDVEGILVPTFGATMDSLYGEPSSLTALAGTWSEAGNTLTINADGTFSELQSSGCMVSGAYTILDAAHNLYGVSFQVTGCTSAMAGIAFTGLGYLNDSNPAARQFIEVVSGPDPAVTGGTMLVSLTITQ
jgi:hypothetical protein